MEFCEIPSGSIWLGWRFHSFMWDQSCWHKKLSVRFSLAVVSLLSWCFGPESSKLQEVESQSSKADLGFPMLVAFPNPPPPHASRWGTIVGTEGVFLTNSVGEMVEWLRLEVAERGINTERWDDRKGNVFKQNGYQCIPSLRAEAWKNGTLCGSYLWGISEIGPRIFSFISLVNPKRLSSYSYKKYLYVLVETYILDFLQRGIFNLNSSLLC